MYLNAKGLELKLSGAVNSWPSATITNGYRYGTSGNDIFQSSKAETVVGYGGDDFYNLFNSGSKVVEAANGGIDTVYIQYYGGGTLADNVENLVLVSAGATFGTGNAINNIIFAGVSGATLNGKAGDDILVGGDGADIFAVEAGNGSDAIYNFKAGWDAVKLTGYGVTSFSQLKGLGKQVGADVEFTFANGEKLVMRDVKLGNLSASDFQLPQDATPVPTGFAQLTKNSQVYISNGWFVLNNMWGVGSWKQGTDFTINTVYNPKDASAGVTFTWSVPLTTDAAAPIRGYPEIIFGAAPNGGGGVNKTDTAHVFPVKVGDVMSLKADYDVSYSGHLSGFDVAFDIWFTNKEGGDASTISNELMVWLHKGSFAPYGVKVGTYTHDGFTADIWHTGTYTAIVATSDLTKGQIDIADMMAALRDMGILSNNEYLASVELGAEPVSGSGTLTINNLDLTLESKTADGGSTIKAVTGSGTTVTTIAPNHAPEISSLGGGEGASITINENTLAVVKVVAADSDGDKLTYSISGLDAALFNIDSATGQLSFKTAPDFEKPQDADHNNIYEVKVSVTDGKLTDDQTIQVSVANVNEAPTVAATKAVTAKAGYTTADFAIGATDVDGDTLSYSIKAGSGPSRGTVEFDQKTGSFHYLASGAAAGTDQFTVQISDGHGGLSYQTVSVDITQGIDRKIMLDGSFLLTALDVATTLTGGLLNDKLVGGAGADYLDGGVGADIMAGGDGNDTYVVDNAGDVVVEAWNNGKGGVDTVLSSVSYTLGVNVENLTLTGTANINATGNVNGGNVLTGNSGNNILDGGEGADWLIGGDGDDTYIVDNIGDKVIEAWNNGKGGVDTVKASISYALGVNVEHLILTGTANIDGTGNEFGNNITGNDGNNVITGGAGNDVIDGGKGFDTAVFSGKAADYRIISWDGKFLVTDTNLADGNDGTDILTGIEQLKFGDGKVIGISSPLVFDLDGNGVRLTSLANSSAYFDHNGDGIADRTTWFAKGDGVLFLDRDGNGTISGENEMSFVNDVPGAASDLAGLAAFDSNGDHKLTAADAMFDKFKMFVDKNGDGKADAGEIVSLADLGITSISLTGTPHVQTVAVDSPVILNTGTFTYADGKTGSLADVVFAYEPSQHAADLVHI